REQMLSTAPLFAELSSEERRRLAELSQTRLYAPDEAIVREGEAGEEMFLILRGHVSVSMQPSDAERVSINRLGPGEFFGEMSLVRGAKRSATAHSVADCWDI